MHKGREDNTYIGFVFMTDKIPKIPKEDLCKECKELPKEPGFERCMLCLKKLDTPVKVYRGLISGRIEKWRDEKRNKNTLQPATKEEIEQLRLERERALLNRDIAEAKEVTKKRGLDGWKILRSVVGSEGSPMHQERPRRKKGSRDSYDRAGSVMDSAVGKKDQRDYSDLTG